MTFTSFGSKWTWKVTWYIAKVSWLRYSRLAKQAKMAKLSQPYQNPKKSHIWLTDSNFDKLKAKSR